MSDVGSERNRKEQNDFKPYFDWRHYLLGSNMAAATLQLLASAAVACTIFGVVWVCFVE